VRKFEKLRIDWMVDALQRPSTMEFRPSCLHGFAKKQAEDAAIKERGIEMWSYTDSVGTLFGSDYAAPGAQTAEALGLGAD
jgi:hypothetical protein